MSSFTIAFDVPESENPPLASCFYPTWIESALTNQLEYATRFDTEEAAEAFLASESVAGSLRPWGVVVEVAS